MNQQAVAQQTNVASSSPPVRYGLLQRQCACGTHTIGGSECESCRKEKASIKLQRAAINSQPFYEVPSSVHEALRTPGQPLDAATRAFFEPRFGYDLSRAATSISRTSQSALIVGSANDPLEREADEFAGNALRTPSSQLTPSTQETRADLSRIRIHTDALAAESSRAVNALAYTVGNHIVFGTGSYAPTTVAGKRLLAHELAHTIQQGGPSAVVQRACDPTKPPLDTRTKPTFFPNQRSIVEVFEGKTTLKEGSTRFAATGLVQQALVDLGFNLGIKGPNKDGVTRKFDPETTKAVGDFQMSEAVTGSKPGVVDQATIKCLDEQRSHLSVTPPQAAADISETDVQVTDEESGGRDEDIFFERGESKLDIIDRLKITFLVNRPTNSLQGCPITLEGYMSEDELAEFGPSLAQARINAVDAEFRKLKHDEPGDVCKTPSPPLRKHSPLPQVSAGVSEYRQRRKVEIVPSGDKSTTAPCPPKADQDRKLSKDEQTIVKAAIDQGVKWMKTAFDKLAPKNAEGEAALTAYFGGIAHRKRIRAKLLTWLNHLNTTVRKRIRHGTDCNASCRTPFAFNTGSGASANITLCKTFFGEIARHPSLSEDEKKAFVIMHEAGHGSIDTTDTGYGHRRLIEFLSQYPDLAEANTDSYTLMVLCLNDYTQFCAAPTTTDSPVGLSDLEKTASRRGLGWLQTWLTWMDHDTSGMYTNVNLARQRGKGVTATSEYYGGVFDLLVAAFKINRPPEDPPPTLQEQTMVSAVLDRILQMKDAVLPGLEVEKATGVPPASDWTLGPGRKVFLAPDYFLLTGDRDRVEHLLPLILRATTNISTELEPIYESYIKANIKKNRDDVPKK